ncbi:MAG: PilZ domain-containing protein [Thermodesulfobacteriota bacterium]|nr:PilZ domain-containing protein [Thermodesulfobacteriota bacterium]
MSHERRDCKRFALNHPVMMGASKDSRHLAEILDVSVLGMRVRMSNQSVFNVGQEVNVACLPQQNQTDTQIFRCCVVWENAGNLEVGLKYLQ